MQADMRFPKTVKAARQHDLTAWAIGDALLAECKDQDNGQDGYDAVVAELKEHGIDHTNRYLRLLRQTAEDFPKSRRYDGEHNSPVVAIRAHTAAGNPDTLDVIVKVTKREGYPTGLHYIESVLQQLRADESKKRNKARQQAERDLAEADSEKKAAEKRRDNATTDTEREKARRDRDRAEERRKKASEQAKASKGRPPRRETKAPSEDEIGPLAAKAFFMKSASQAKRLATNALKQLHPHLDDLSPAAAAGLKDAALSVTNEWREVSQKIKSKGKGHLSPVSNAVNE
jgi:hypothetical protein